MENLDKFLEYSPVVMVVFLFFIQSKIFVTSQELERKHREILQDVEQRFAPSYLVKEVKSQMEEIKDKIDKIYDFFLKSQ